MLSSKKLRNSKQRYSPNDVAIVGIACRFPGASDYNQFWDNLSNGVNSIREITPDRWDIHQFYSKDRDAINKSISKWGGLMDRVDTFDAPFFHISAREAQSMDPQQRILLEEVWHCIEDAGVPLRELRENKTSVYVGAMATDYYQYVAAPERLIDGYSCLGNYEGILSNRLSYFFDLTGESQSLDAACASSLVAMHHARRSLLHGESDYAIAAGVSIICHPWKYISFSKAHMLSPKGQCKTFDAEADGYVPGEGVGVLLLETVENALKKGHHIYGIYKGSSVHHNGKTKSITAPQIDAQRRVIQEAYVSGCISPETITYLEAHGTGTSLGDPIEVEALTTAFDTPLRQFCYIGAVKTNIGHLEAAAGMAGVIKVLLMLKHKKIPPTLNIKNVNPILDFENSPFCLADKLTDWILSEKTTLRRAGVSSFGFGGTSSHVVIEEYQPKAKVPKNMASKKGLPFILSAKSAQSLMALLEHWNAYCKTADFAGQSLEDICYTLASGREAFPFRLGCLVYTKNELIHAVKKAHAEQQKLEDTASITALRATIICLQPIALPYARFHDICQQFPVLSRMESECEQAIGNIVKVSVKMHEIHDETITKYAVLRQFLMQYILCKSLLATGLQPRCIMGNGVGKLAGAVISRMLEFDTAVQYLSGMNPEVEIKRPQINLYDSQSGKIIRYYQVTSEYLAALIKGIKIAPEKKAIIFNKTRELIKNQYTFKQLLAEWDKSLIAFGLDLNTVLTNASPLIENQERLILIILLSSMKKLNEKWDLAAKITIDNTNAAEMIDLVLDKVLSEEETTKLFLAPGTRQIQRTVEYIQSHGHAINSNKPYVLLKKYDEKIPEIQISGVWLDAMLSGLDKSGDRVPDDEMKHPWYIDIGEGKAVQDTERFSLRADNLRRDLPVFLMQLWRAGFLVNWQDWYSSTMYHTVPLPVYPFERERYWFEEGMTPAVAKLHPLLDTNISTLDSQCFLKLLTSQEFYLRDHCVLETQILPAAAYVEMVRAAALLSVPDADYIGLSNIMWTSPIRVVDVQVVTVRIHRDSSGATFEVLTGDQSKIMHAQGNIIFQPTSRQGYAFVDVEHIQKHCDKPLFHDEIYTHFDHIGLNYGPGFRVIRTGWVNVQEILAKIQLSSGSENTNQQFYLHPALLDGALQTALLLLQDKDRLFLPFGIEQIDIFEALPSECYVHATLVAGSEERNLPKFTIQIINEEGTILVGIKGLTVKQLSTKPESNVYFYRPCWKRKPTNENRTVTGVMLVFDDSDAFIQELRSALFGLLIIQVKFGDGYQLFDHENYQINKTQREDYSRLLNDIAKQNSYPDKIMYWPDEDLNAFLTLFNLSQALIAFKPVDSIQLLCLTQKRSIFSKALTGFAKTLHWEQPRLTCKIITAAHVADLSNELNSEDVEVRYDKKRVRWVRSYREIVYPESVPVLITHKTPPVYLITGGVGGLGLIFARYFAEHYQAKLVLTGRRDVLNAEQQSRLADLENFGSEVIYVPSDVSKRSDVTKLMQTIKGRFGQLNGVIHGAGVLRDSFILKKTPDEIAEVFAPKIQGTHFLDEATQHEPLDYFILFSSMVSILGNIGQSDYAYANAYMDAFAASRERKRIQQKRPGKTLAINWPLWSEGGMQIDEASMEWLENTFGVKPLATIDGVAALLKAMVLPHHYAQQIVLVGNKQVLERVLGNSLIKSIMKDNAFKNAASSEPENISDLKKHTEDYLKKVLSQALNLAPEKINASHSFERYGIDSLMIVNLNRILEKDFPDLPKTLFFEYLTLATLVDYFIENHKEYFSQKYISQTEVKKIPSADLFIPPQSKQQTGKINRVKQADNAPFDIAIIGISGRYPQARNVEIFWENLKAGKDSVTEIPFERWDYHKYFDPDKNKEGKSYSKWGGFIDDFDKFDPLFFGISPQEAELMDPQERLFLETAWQAIEDAGYTRVMLSPQQVGVFVGVMYGEYQLFGVEETLKGNVMSTNPLYAYIANRVSWFFDLHGPSIALDTMCSSSLTSVHLACQSIRQGECQIAIAGGVNLSIHPNKYIFLSRGKFLASDGRCRSFGEGGDGYVPGEGVGAVVLKPLPAALAEGDHIYGIIKGSRTNHGGKTHGFTVPNPSAQAALIDSAFKDANINPATISYIEAHGTGTSLGDPIEITGLNKIFGQEKRSVPYAIGSVKSNIGHLESAAGIAAITKVLLQMKHKTLVPSLHSETLNTNINWANIPFKVQRELSEWNRLETEEGGVIQDIPRRSVLSSFGAGGSNAHLIIEEAPEENAIPSPQTKPVYLLGLSAKKAEPLKQKIEDLHNWLLKNENLSLEDISYTLNIGRDHFEKRCAFIVRSMSELLESLVLAAKGQISANYVTNMNSEQIINEPIFEELREKIQYDLEQNPEPEQYIRKLHSLGDLYVKGIDVDWGRLHAGEANKKISLPTYPFVRERYWVPNTTAAIISQGDTLHPLLDANSSTFEQQSFSKQFTGNEFYIADHCIHGDHLVPGVIYLEMAKKAGELAAPGHIVTGLKDIWWMQPVAVSSEAVTVQIMLQPHETGATFEVTTGTMHAEGIIIYDSIVSAPEKLDLLVLKNRCSQVFSQTELYTHFDRLGFHYGANMQGIMAYSKNDFGEAIARIELPKGQLANSHQFALHPAILDGALQTVLGLLTSYDIKYLPFNIGQIDIYNVLPQTCYAYTRLLPDVDNSHPLTCHITITDEAGTILVDIHDLILRATKPGKGIFYYQPYWEQSPLDGSVNTRDSSTILLFDNIGQITRVFRDKLSPESIIHVTSGTAYHLISPRDYQLDYDNVDACDMLFKSLAEHDLHPKYMIFNQLDFYAGFNLVQAMLKQKMKGDITVIFVNAEPSLAAEAVSGFVKTIHLEQPSVTGRVIECNDADDLLQEFNQTDIEVRYDNNHVRWVKQYREKNPIDDNNQPAMLRQNGVYLISGGMGGLGLIFARYLAEHYQARLVLSGRSELHDKQKVIQDELIVKGADVLYVQSDITKIDDVQKLIQIARKKYGRLNGIIHSAGVVRDAFIIKKSGSEITEVLAPKIDGTLNLDIATQNEPLDFFVLFSSVSACYGNIGQCDYAYGNAFEDAFAHHREALQRENKRQGRTISINWPLWADGGMHVDESSIQWLENTFGIVPLATEDGIKAFLDAFLHAGCQQIVLPGYRKKMEQVLNARGSSQVKIEPASPVSHNVPDNLKQKTEEYIKQLISGIIKLAPKEINATEAFENYGIDSVMIMKLNQKLEQDFGALPKTLFFEYLTPESLAAYFMENHQEVLSRKWSIEPQIIVPELQSSASITIASRFGKRAQERPGLVVRHQDIAIIGMSGRYPQANDMNAFWENLQAGKDSVTEIPKERWDNDLYFDPDKEKPGKTYGKWGGFIDDVDKFDPGFFNISPREAALMDPQERLFLETSWKTLEDAGYTRDSLRERQVGVFVGAMFHQYQLFGAEELSKRNVLVTNSVSAYIANRVSYFMDFHGPSITLDTMCSSSLTSLHLACDNLRLGRCQLALAGGVNLSLHPNKYILLSQGKFLATDGRCRSFGEGGDGYVPAEGVGAVLLKPLQDALADGDHIYGIIKGSSVNHDGKTNGLTVPNPALQAALITDAFKDAGLSPATVSYIETHGTGTALGDPIEITGLVKAFGVEKRTQPYVIGSVKSNIGHAESAAGIAALSKVLLQMQHQTLVPSLHSATLNSNINWHEIPFRVQQALGKWECLETSGNGVSIPRRASISSFGAGGSNAHIIIEEAPASTAQPDSKSACLITVSAKTDRALQEKIADLMQWLDKQEEDTLSLENISFTLNAGRAHFEQRAAFVVTSIAELKTVLSHMIVGEIPETVFMGSSVKPHDFAIFKKVFRQLMQELQAGGSDYQDNLSALAHFYVTGYAIDWNVLYEGKSKRRISLPTYPFEKMRCWIDVAPTSEHPPSAQVEEKPAAPMVPEEDLPAFSLSYLQHIFAEILQFPMAQLAPDKTYEVFGIDSVLGLTLIKRMEQDFGSLSQTLLYEKNRLHDLNHYFLKHHQTTLQALQAKMSDELRPLAGGNVIDTSVQVPVTELAVPVAIDDDIAIIGLSGKYPEAETLAEFWENLKNARDCVTRVPENRWRPEDFPVENNNGQRYHDKGGFLKDVDKFDPLFFNIPPNEASIFMDPQERLFLQTAWSAMEDAGYTRTKLEKTVNNNVGVFVGVSFHYYPLYLAEEWFKGNRMPLDIQFFQIANRVSYFFNFTGPSLPIDTACSSSLSALHLACESIKRGECLMAIAGGVNLSLHPAKYYMLGATGFMSEQGRCASFAANGNGYVPAEGVGAVILKSLRQALADNDHIYGVIRASAMNHGGKTSGFTVPNPNAQTALIAGALAKSGIDARNINYIEAHGTGTSLGDPIEIKGLQSAFENYTRDKQFCAIGSVKSNIGHAEAAAGISQLTKVLLQMQHQTLVPSIHAEQLNPYIDFSETAFYVQRESSAWNTLPGKPRLAGISSFGAGGANAFMLVEAFSAAPAAAQIDSSPAIFVLSANDANVLKGYAQLFLEFLQREKHAMTINNLCYSLQIGREAMPARLAIVAHDFDDLLEGLTRYLHDPEQAIKAGLANHASQAAEQLSVSQPTETDYLMLARQWVTGLAIQWESLYTHRPNLVPLLPTYPFVKRRCWVPGNNAFLDKPFADAAIQLPDPAQWLYQSTWVMDKPHDYEALITPDTTWLILGDDALAPALHMDNNRVIHCHKGDGFIQKNKHYYAINPANADDYRQLLSDIIDKQNIPITNILYLWPIHDTQQDASEQVLFLTQALSKYSLKNKPTFWMTTQGAQSVFATEHIQIWQHHLWAFANIFALETHDYTVKFIDLDPHTKLQEQARWLEQMVTHKTDEHSFAYREGNTYILRLSQHLPKQANAVFNAPIAALVSGGLGALGLEVSSWLVTQGTKYLLLTGNTDLPDRADWSRVEDPKLKNKINGLLALEAKGARVYYLAANVGDKAKMSQAVNDCEALWQQSIDGVFHLAGITTNNIPVPQMTTERLQEVMEPKVQGTLVLHELFQSASLKYFVLFSSVSAVPWSGIPGLSAYATANAFLEGVAQYRRSLGLPSLCINWSAWAEKGMSIQYHQDEFLDAIGVSTIPIASGISLLNYLLSTDITHVIVQNIDWQKFMRVNSNLKRIPFFANVVPLENKDSNYAPRTHEDVLTVISTLFSEMLQLQSGEIDIGKPFQEYGLDSINGIKFTLNLNQAFPDRIAQTDLYRYVTIKQLAEYIHSQDEPIAETMPDSDEQLLQEIYALDDNEVSELLERELQELQGKGADNE